MGDPIIIQIDDEVRDATAEEIAALEHARASAPALPEPTEVLGDNK